MNKKAKTLLTLLLGFSALETKAQLAVGAIAPDFTLTDTKGAAHNLYTYLNSGKAVVVDVFASWCPPCWSYHKKGQGALGTFYTTNGPEGSNKAMVFMVEGDPRTNTECLSGRTGCTGGSQGNWLEGTQYPIINPVAAESRTFATSYKVRAYPTIYMICPDKKIIYRGQGSASTLQTNMNRCAVSTSLLDPGIGAQVSVYPSISSGKVHVRLGDGGSGKARVEVYNAMGEIVSARDAGVAGLNAVQFDLTAQQDGFYFVKVKTSAGVITRKIILEK